MNKQKTMHSKAAHRPMPTTSTAAPAALTVPLIRQQSYSTISRLIAESMSKPQSPLMPSPKGAAEVRSILQRLEQVETESRDLLRRVFSLVQTDARLEGYIRRQLENPRVSGMWVLIEQILAGLGDGTLDIDGMLDDEKYSNQGDHNPISDFSTKSLKATEEFGGDDGMRTGRMKCRTFHMDGPTLLPPPPPPPPPSRPDSGN